MRISVIVPAFNAARHLERAVTSLVGTGYPDLEIVIVDDGSRDTTLDVARQLEARLPGVARVVANGANRGVSASRNRGIAESTGELVCFLDADDYVFPARFETAVALLAGDERVDAVYEKSIMAFENPADRGGWVESSDLFGIAEQLPPEHVLETLLGGKCWAVSALICRRSLLSQTGLFDERLHFAEDCHLWFRMASVGRIASGSASPVSAYFRHASNSYQNKPERKIDMVVAMIDAYRWARARRLAPEVLTLFRRRIREYLHNGVISARESGCPDVALRMMGVVAASGCADLLVTPGLARQIPHAMLEAIRLRARKR